VAYASVSAIAFYLERRRDEPDHAIPMKSFCWMGEKVESEAIGV
jgi:hypothetical protein